MTWDDEKNTFETQPSVPDDEKLTADEWNQHVTDQKDHSDRHESGGIDEISVAGLSGELADPQDPKQEAVEDFVDALLTGGDKITLSYDDTAGSLTVDTSALDTEEVEDAVEALLVGGDNTTLTYDDANDSLTVDVDAPTEAEFTDHSARHEDGGADAIDVTGLSGVLADAQTPQTEAVEDIVDGLLAAGSNIGLTYDDGAGTLTIDTSALDAEEVRDEVGGLLSGGNGITITVDDAGDTVTLSIPTDAVAVDELDETISPTWTGEHEFSAGITGLPDPTDASDAARKSYVDAIKQGLDAKDSVVATTAGSNIDLTSSTDPNPVDGVTLADGDRVLLKDQSDGTENGIYVAPTATDPTTWSRAPDADADDEVTSGLFTFVEEGGANANDGYILATDGDITLGTTSLSFVQFSGAGDITAGDGLTKSGDTLDVSVGDFAGVALADSGSNDLDVQREQIEDWIGALIAGGTEITVNYDDPNDTLTINSSAASDPHDNTAHSETYTTTAEDVENFSTSGSDGTVPTSDGAGNLTMEPVEGNVPGWQEDANSPKSVNSSSLTYTVSGDYDFVMVFRSTPGFTGIRAELTINGDTGDNYGYYELSGANTTNANFIPIGDVNKAAKFVLLSQNGGVGVNVDSFEASGGITAADNKSVSGDINSFTLSDEFDSAREEKIRVFGYSP